ncbi:hypothetical protein VNO77_18951 [Canavalia gladiata]|uniref:Uncharacterized protein n=1 Tax=Canavalia gladiata TaxID=3824 RepID=A0AAN9QK34_CANGL
MFRKRVGFLLRDYCKIKKLLLHLPITVCYVACTLLPWSFLARFLLQQKKGQSVPYQEEPRRLNHGVLMTSRSSWQQDWSTSFAILEPYARVKGGDFIIHEDHAYCSARGEYSKGVVDVVKSRWWINRARGHVGVRCTDHVSFSTTPGSGFISGVRALHHYYQRQEYPIVPGLLPSFRRPLCVRYIQKMAQNCAHH